MPDVRRTPDDGAPTAVVPDYPLDEAVRAHTARQLKALAEPTRLAILDLVLERAATTSELAVALGKPKGTVDHHLKVLEGAGLVRVVRTRRVRAMEERYWGRTGRTVLIEAPTGHPSGAGDFVRQALAEARPARDGEVGFSSLRHARIPAERAEEFTRRLDALTVEFASLPRGGDTVYGFLAALFPTDHPVLPPAGGTS